MYSFSGDGLLRVYKDVAESLLNNGIESCPRGKKILEFINVSFEIKNPRKRLVCFKERQEGFNLCHAIAETYMLVREKNGLQYFNMFNKNINQFSDDGKTVRGCYGKRISNEIDKILDLFNRDQDTRQAVVNIYSASKDLGIATKDVPCTETLQFLIRDNKLHMIVNMRSNDIMWGFPYDVFMFTSLQEIIANTVGVELGSYYHNVGSFHVYEEFYGTLNAMLNGKAREVECEELSGMIYDEFLNESEIYVNAVDNQSSIYDEIEYGAYSGYINVLAKEIEYRRFIEGKAKMDKIKCDWAGNFTQRWNNV